MSIQRYGDHGTYARYQKHRKAGERPCEPCLIASREYMKDYRRKNVDQPLVAAIQAEGFAAGVKAARDAVANVPVMLVDARFNPDDASRYVGAVNVIDALAAIDGVEKEKS